MNALESYALTALVNNIDSSPSSSSLMNEVYKWRAKFAGSEAAYRAMNDTRYMLLEGIRKLIDDPNVKQEVKDVVMQYVGIGATENKEKLRAIYEKIKGEEFAGITRRMSGVE